MGHVGVRWVCHVRVGWCGSCRGGVDHVGGGVGHVGIGVVWVM